MRYSPHGQREWRWVVVVQSLGFQERLDSIRGFVGVVPRKLVEEVVSDVCGTNAVVEKVKDSIRAIDRGESALEPGPFFDAVVRNRGIGVVQPGVNHQPCVHPSVRSPVPQEDGTVANMELSRVKKRSNEGELRHCGEKNLIIDLSGKHGTAWAVMVSDAVVQRSAVVSQFARGTPPEQVNGITRNKVKPEAERSETTVSECLVQDCHVAKTLVVLSQTNILLARRHVRFAVNQMVHTAMVLCVGILPCKVRHEHNLVHDEAKEIVERLVRRKGAY